ncbi:MAG TPA: hypothetical protein VIJ72_02435 [Rhizomicrobium sp.]
MGRTGKAILGLAGLALLAGPANAASCLRLSYIRDWKRMAGNTMEVGDDFGNRYKVTLTGACKGLNLRHALEVHSLAGEGMSCMAPGDIVTGKSDISMSASKCAVGRIAYVVPALPAPPVSPRRDRTAVVSPALDGWR